jgi:hypothetical protein
MVDPWQGLYLASTGRLELTNSCMSSLPLFAMSLYMLHDSTYKAMDKHRSRFFWEGVRSKRKYHMVDWATVCKPKAFDGLGFLNTKLMNISLMLKWIRKLYQAAEGLWANLIRAKYLDGRDLFSNEVPTVAHSSGTPSRKSNGTSNSGPNTRFTMGSVPTSGLTGGLAQAPCIPVSLDCLDVVCHLLPRCRTLGS